MFIWKALFMPGTPEQIKFIERAVDHFEGRYEATDLQTALEMALEDVPEGHWLAAVRVCSAEEANEFETSL